MAEERWGGPSVTEQGGMEGGSLAVVEDSSDSCREHAAEESINY